MNTEFLDRFSWAPPHISNFIINPSSESHDDSCGQTDTALTAWYPFYQQVLLKWSIITTDNKTYCALHTMCYMARRDASNKPSAVNWRPQTHKTMQRDEVIIFTESPTGYRLTTQTYWIARLQEIVVVKRTACRKTDGSTVKTTFIKMHFDEPFFIFFMNIKCLHL